MQYKTVKRVITIEFVQPPRGSGYDVRITPEQAVVRYKDIVEWHVQGLSARLMKDIGIGNFVRLDASLYVKKSKKGLAADKPAGPKQPVKSKSADGVLTLSLDLAKADPGFYKYDVLNQGKTLLDPELEIRGPRS